jgi:hypothetical protein
MMSSKSQYIFVLSEELLGWLASAQQLIGFSGLLYTGPQQPLEPWSPREGSFKDGTTVYFSKTSLMADDINPRLVPAAELGLVSLDVPRIRDRTLLACQLGAKSDWYDARSAKMRDNREALRLFSTVWKQLGPHLRRPVWARNRRDGASAAYKAISYSPGAEEWVRNGGELRQEGVANVEFLLDPGSPSES